ncbi:FtsK/SpoIIIE domain-containing protein [Metabacillus arenae]|uniref:DNA translocase FtsK n=1 Tax=Metabacillus arenae TaxID=2771434 RepID=A0A926NJ85_9BACI|nr:FtsK/SpoIIIE domain-containing protein [Metabacillus arenae]MBD1381553.1 DNA translocase FtsK [Metabacillus arenae]
MKTYNQILGKWIFNILLAHFKEQKQEITDKLFIKINGLTNENVEAVLCELKNRSNLLEEFYSLTVRTIKPVNGFSDYKLQPIETSTWLRNYTFSGNALVIIINDHTPEAQSLENLFSIDEAYLLSDFGLKSLYSLLSEYGIAAEEIESLQEFFRMYSSLTEPQLRYILRFLDKVVNQDSPSIIEKIQTNLPELNLFRDKNLIIGSKGLKRLNANFLLANLQKNNGDLDTEKLQNNLYTFIEAEEKNNFTNEIWSGVNPSEFELEVIDFLNHKNLILLKYDFNVVESVLNFKTKTTLPEKIRETLTLNSNLMKEQIEKIEDGISEIEKNQNADAIQDFFEEFESELSKTPGLVKAISRRIEKLRHPKIYCDLINALHYEAFSMIEENTSAINNTSYLRLTINSTKLTFKASELLKIYLKNFTSVVPMIKLDNNLLDNIKIDESANEEELSFKLTLINNDQSFSQETFKVTGFNDLKLLSLVEAIFEQKIPYLRNYQEEEIELLDVKELVYKQIQGYISINEPGVKEHYNLFSAFLEKYTNTLNKVVTDGIFSIEINTLKEELNLLLRGVTSSVIVSSHIYKFINNIGSIDTLDVKLGQSGYSDERVVTIFHPIRLISYISRYQSLNEQITEWINRSIHSDLEVTNLDDYLEYVNEKTLHLAPRYFSSDGDDSFLIEVNEVLGEGQFILNSKRTENMDYLSTELSEELVRSVKNYFEVYPYAKDGMDILFLYCQSADIITKSIDVLFNKIKSLRKLKITVHSTQAAYVHQKINQWIKQKEEYTNPDRFGKFPSVEVKVISGNTINEISRQINSHMIDADLVVLADYFGQSNQIKYDFDKIEFRQTDNWFGVVYKEPLLETEQMKRISYVSEDLPELLKSFYQLQYIYQKKEMLAPNELYILKNKISLSNFSDNELIDYMHENFNWIMFMDRYLDKSLLEKASSKAQIIQYKSKAGTNKNFKLIVSSSEYIKKLNSNNHDYEYYDRLKKKLSLILKNDYISKAKIVDAVNHVKSISGALVLKAIGPGKYSHELVATYLSKKYRSIDNSKLQVWSVCDELPWFGKNNRRPDLIITTINENDGTINLDFELLELKFVNQSLFERERYDAIKQIQSGKNLYEKIFDFNQEKIDADYWRNELIHYFIEREAYSPEKAYLLKKLQNVEIEQINVNIHSSIDSYCYTSNLYENRFEQLDADVYLDIIEGEYTNYIYNRAYILNALGVEVINEPEYEELENNNTSFSEIIMEDMATTDLDNIDEGPSSSDLDSENGDTETKIDTTRVVGGNPPENKSKYSQYESGSTSGNENVVVYPDLVYSFAKHYPEVEALKSLELNRKDISYDHSDIKRKYVTTLETHFNRNNLNVKVNEVIIGSSVTRLILILPSSLNIDKVLRRRKDIQIWLGIDQEPNMFIDKNGLNIDIVRDEPDTIYFEEFMAIARQQINKKINQSNLIAPMGFDPLNNVISIDLSDPSTPHLLTGGTTGSGKSVTLNSIILGTMCFYEPSKLQFLFIDPKQVEFANYENLPHTESVVTNINEAVDTLNMMVEEMERRYSLFKKEFASNLDEYIELTKEELPRIVIVFDEFADFMSQEKEIVNQVENAILRLGQKARAAGIHLIICTQNPKSDIINTNIRNNLGARLALRATDSNASSIILGESGAENLGGKGDFLAKTSSQKVIRGKSPFLTAEVKRALLKYFMSKRK